MKANKYGLRNTVSFFLKKVKIIVKVMRDNAPFTLKMLAEIKVLGSLQNSYGTKFLILKSSD